MIPSPSGGPWGEWAWGDGGFQWEAEMISLGGDHLFHGILGNIRE